MSFADYEREFKEMKEAQGCYVVRSAGSLAVDLVIYDPKTNTWSLVEVKSIKPSVFTVRKKKENVDQWKEMLRLVKAYPKVKTYYAIRKKGIRTDGDKWAAWRLVKPKDLVKPFHWK